MYIYIYQSSSQQLNIYSKLSEEKWDLQKMEARVGGLIYIVGDWHILYFIVGVN